MAVSASLPSTRPVRALFLLISCTLLAQAVVPPPTPRLIDTETGLLIRHNRTKLPSGGGDYSLGSNYAPYFLGSVDGDAQDVDNDNNNNDDNNNDNNNDNNHPASLVGDMNDVEIEDDSVNLNLNLNVNPDLNGNRNHFRDSEGHKGQPLPPPAAFWTPADVINLVKTVMSNMPNQTSSSHVRVNGKEVSPESFTQEANALRELKKTNALTPQLTPQSRAPHIHIHNTELTRRVRKAGRVPEVREVLIRDEPCEGPPSQCNNGTNPEGGGGGGVYNVDSNFGPVFDDQVKGARQADDNDNNNNADNNNDNNNDNNDDVQILGSGNRFAYRTRDVNYNLNLNLNYNDNQNDNYDNSTSKPLTEDFGTSTLSL